MVSGAGRAGGSLSVADLIDDHGDAIEADLQRIYGLDLLDMYRGSLSPGKVLRLVQWLPDDGAFAASLQGGPEFLGHGRARALAMDQWDLTAVAAAGKRAPKYPRPKAARRRRTGEV